MNVIMIIGHVHNKRMPLDRIEKLLTDDPELLKVLTPQQESKLLREAVKMKYIKIVDLIIEYSVDINPLELAIAGGDFETVIQLLDDGVKLDDHPKWEIFYLEMYLFELRKWKNRKEIILILVNSLDVKNIPNKLGKNLLHRLSVSQMVYENDDNVIEVTESLLKAEVSVTERDEGGRTPLHEFAFRKNVKLVKLLIDQGADVNNKDNNLRTPLHSAAFGGNVKNLKMLLSSGADIDARDNNGYTVLHDACRNRSAEEAIRFLINKNSDMINALNQANQTPLNLLLSSQWKFNYDACVNLMLRELRRSYDFGKRCHFDTVESKDQRLLR